MCRFSGKRKRSKNSTPLPGQAATTWWSPSGPLTIIVGSVRSSYGDYRQPPTVAKFLLGGKAISSPKSAVKAFGAEDETPIKPSIRLIYPLGDRRGPCVSMVPYPLYPICPWRPLSALRLPTATGLLLGHMPVSILQGYPLPGSHVYQALVIEACVQ